MTKTVFFTQHQGDQADFSDGSTDLVEFHSTLEAGLAAFKAAHGHRRLLALEVDFFTKEPKGAAMELQRV